MPHIAKIICLANRLLDGLDPDTAGSALASLAETNTILEAVNQAGLLNSLSGEQRADAEAALAALPPTVNTGLRSALIGALERNLPAIIQWKPGAQTDLQVWESVDGEEGMVGLLLITPWGRDLGAATP